MALFPSFLLPKPEPGKASTRAPFKIKPPKKKVKPPKRTVPVAPPFRYSGGGNMGPPAPSKPRSPKLVFVPGQGWVLPKPAPVAKTGPSKAAPVKNTPGKKAAPVPWADRPAGRPVTYKGESPFTPSKPAPSSSKPAAPVGGGSGSSKPAPTKTAPAPKPAAPVGGGSGSTGGGGAAGSAVKTGGTKTPTTPAAGSTTTNPWSTGDPELDKVFGPLVKEMQAQKQRNDDMKLKADADMTAFQNWMTSQLTTSQDHYTNNMKAAQAGTSAALTAAAQGMQGLTRGTDPGMDAATGISSAETVNAARANLTGQDAQVSQNVQAAINARLQENPAIISGRVGQLRSDMGDRFAKVEADYGKNAATMMSEMAKAKVQKDSDARTAEALGLQQQTTNDLAQQRLNLDAAKAAAQEARQGRLDNSTIALNQAKRTALLTKKSSATKGKQYQDFSALVIAQRKRAFGGRFDTGKVSDEERYQTIISAAAYAQHLQANWGAPNSFITWALNDVYGAPNVQKALAWAKAQTAAAGA